MPVHGEYRHLVIHAKLRSGGDARERVCATDGDVLEIDEEMPGRRTGACQLRVHRRAWHRRCRQHILRDRAHLSTDGVVVVIVTVDKQTGKLERAAEVLARGFIDVDDREDLLERAKQVVADAIKGVDHYAELGDINARIRDAVSKFLYDETRRRPMVLTVTVEV